MQLCLVLLAALLIGDQTVLTRDGRRHIGKVTASGPVVVIDTLSGRVEVPAEKVACIFTDPADAVKRADALYALAKKSFEEARDLPSRDPRRNPALQASIDILAQARDIYEALTRYYDGERWNFLSKSLSTSMQLMRIIRDQKGSDVAMGVASEAPVIVDLATGDYSTPVAPPKEKKYILQGDLGTGQVALEKGLESEDGRIRVETLRKLSSPPAPHAIPALVALLERETNDDVLKAAVETLALHDASSLVKLLAFATKVSAPGKRLFLTALLKAAGDKAACELLVDWLVETPPGDDRIRAAICSAFRKMRDHATRELKDALTKSKDRRVQSEILKQMGTMADKRNAPFLIQAITTFRTAAVAGLIDIGKPGLPRLIEGIAGGDAEQKKWCVAIARKVSGQDRNTSADFVAWFGASRKQIDAEEEAFWTDQAAKDWPVDPRLFREYERRPEDLVK